MIFCFNFKTIIRIYEIPENSFSDEETAEQDDDDN